MGSIAEWGVSHTFQYLRDGETIDLLKFEDREQSGVDAHKTIEGGMACDQSQPLHKPPLIYLVSEPMKLFYGLRARPGAVVALEGGEKDASVQVQLEYLAPGIQIRLGSSSLRWIDGFAQFFSEKDNLTFELRLLFFLQCPDVGHVGLDDSEKLSIEHQGHLDSAEVSCVASGGGGGVDLAS